MPRGRRRSARLPIAWLALLALAACMREAPEPPAGMVLVPAGEFLMGSAPGDQRVSRWQKPATEPQHPVYVDAFFIDRHETTNAEFERVRPGHARNARSPCDDCPVTDVTWFEARDYCAAQQKRLPTEAEWEKAAKGGTEVYPELLKAYAWFSKNSYRRAHPVGRLAPNGYGVHDMLGNAREWTADWYDARYYDRRVRDNPKGPTEGEYRVERGGAFFMPALTVTATIRYNHPPQLRLFFVGFRCARDL